jgi:cytochrome b561
MVNARGGVLINGTRHPVEIISIDVGAQTGEEILQNIAEAIRKIANGTYGEIHATLAPLSSVFSEAHAIEAEKHKILSCAGGKYLLAYY